MCILEGEYVYHIRADELKGPDRALATLKLGYREL